jgi:hypothetical protein
VLARGPAGSKVRRALSRINDDLVSQRDSSPVVGPPDTPSAGEGCDRAFARPGRAAWRRLPAPAPDTSPNQSYGTPLRGLAAMTCSARGVGRWGFRFRELSAAPAMVVRSLGPPTTMSCRLAIGHELVVADCRRKESPMSGLKADFITIIIGRFGAMSLKPC